jgi:phospholipid/cholesterol/gamma-HCH transport system ATP-binding protein
MSTTVAMHMSDGLVSAPTALLFAALALGALAWCVRRVQGELDDRVHQVLRLVGLDHAAAQFPPSISGGMKLRAGLARALVTNPEYVLYDEPNAGLDPIISRQIHELIARVRDELNVTGLIVTHSKACATECGDRIGILDNGKLGVEGSVDEMLRSDHPLARAFLRGGVD